MKILVTGTDGYLGALVAPVLTQRGHTVVGLDTGYFRSGWLYHADGDAPRTINKDLRTISANDVAGFDAIVHMAELSNDPAGQLAPHITYEINHKGSLHLATLAKAAGIERFVYTSSCSVYGAAAEGLMTESSPLNPQTAYAICKTLVERDVMALTDDTFSPTFLRNATAFGASPRMRFDLVLNNLAGLAWTTGRIAMTSDGTPWRPLVHGLDIAKAIACAVESPRSAVHGEIFNVGSTEQNYTVREIAEIVANSFPGCELTFGPSDGDNRSYRVSFDKIRQQLPGFSCEWDAARGAQQLAEIFARIDLDSSTFTGRGHTRLAQLQHLLRTRQINQEFYWSR